MEHPRAHELDAVPYATWLREEIGDEAAREALGFVATGFMTKPSHSFSLLQAAWLLSSAGEVRNLLDADLVLDARVRRRRAADRARARGAARATASGSARRCATSPGRTAASTSTCPAARSPRSG